MATRRPRCSKCSIQSRTTRSTIIISKSITICRKCCSSLRLTPWLAIPEPLSDRMEIIRIPGYLDQEKFAIARQFLVPKQLQANGLEADEVEFEPDVLPCRNAWLYPRGWRA